MKAFVKVMKALSDPGRVKILNERPPEGRAALQGLDGPTNHRGAPQQPGETSTDPLSADHLPAIETVPGVHQIIRPALHRALHERPQDHRRANGPTDPLSGERLDVPRSSPLRSGTRLRSNCR